MPGRELGERDEGTTDRLLGELIAEVRAVKHDQRTTSMKLDAVSSIASTQTQMLARMEKFEREQEKQSFRLGVLEADKNRREGAIGLVAWISRNWPFAFITTVLGAWIAWANGKLHP